MAEHFPSYKWHTCAQIIKVLLKTIDLINTVLLAVVVLGAINNSFNHMQKKQTCLATALAKSLHVSVLPVPAGPSGAPPRLSLRAPISVLQ